VELEQLYVFAKNLNRKLPKSKQRLPHEVVDAVDLDSFRIQQTYEGKIELEKKDGETPGIKHGKPKRPEDEKDLLSNIIEILNETYGAGITEEDVVDIENIKVKLDENEELQAVMNEHNTLENIRMKFDKVVEDLLLDFVHTKIDLYKKLTAPEVNATFKNKWFEGMTEHLFSDGRSSGVQLNL